MIHIRRAKIWNGQSWIARPTKVADGTSENSFHAEFTSTFGTTGWQEHEVKTGYLIHED